MCRALLVDMQHWITLHFTLASTALHLVIKEIRFKISWRKLSWGQGGSKITKFVKVFFLESFLLYGTIGQLLYMEVIFSLIHVESQTYDNRI
jgi:hypothetical protein